MNYRDFIENRYFPDMSTSEKAYVIDQMKDDLLPVITGNTVLTKSYVDNIEIDPGVASEDYLTFTAVESAGATIELKKVNSASTFTSRPIEYRVSTANGTFTNTWSDWEWNVYDKNSTSTTYTQQVSAGTLVTLSSGQSVQFRNKNHNTLGQFNAGTSWYAKFYIGTGKVECHGNIFSLCDKYCTQTAAHLYSFYSLFNGCTNLLTPPRIPATIVSDASFYNCFYGCTNLQYCPELPATQLAPDCYRGMFYNCTSISATPKLMATIASTTATARAYREMFKGCTKLKEVFVNFIYIPTAITATASTTYNWLNGCSTATTLNGVFHKNPLNTLTTRSTNNTTTMNWIPKNWTLVDDMDNT